MRAPHKTVHAECPFGATTWGDCDKITADKYADWQAMQAVLHGMLTVVRDAGKPDHQKWWRKGDTMDEQLIQLIAGRRERILNKDGNPSEAPWVRRFMRAIERVAAGDIPQYNLYGMPASILAALQALEASPIQEGT